jgi:hypothetical protein
VIDFYESGKMQPYTANAPADYMAAILKREPAKRCKSTCRYSGESLLFDTSKRVLTKVDRDGTKYFQSKYKGGGGKFAAIQEALYGL